MSYPEFNVQLKNWELRGSEEKSHEFQEHCNFFQQYDINLEHSKVFYCA